MDMTEKPINQEYIFKGRIINLRVDDALLPDGTVAKREIVEHPGGVCVAALTENNELMFVEQFRYPYAEVVLELPAGKLEEGEEPYSAAVRELREETGLVSDKPLLPLGRIYSSVGVCDECIYLYLAEDVRFTATDFDEDEFLTIKKVPFEKLSDMALSGEIEDAKTVALILKIAAMRARN